MNRGKGLVKRRLLISSIGLAAVVLAGIHSADAQPHSGGSTPTTVVIRGSDPADAQPSSDKDTPPTVLRGSPPPAALPPAAQYACPPGYDYDPSYGCVVPGNAYNSYDYPYDYGYWPYYGFDGFFSTGRRRGIRHGSHGTGGGFATEFGRHSAHGLVHQFAGGLGHGFAYSSGFGRR